MSDDGDGPPPPPIPVERRTPLPHQLPKSAIDEPDAEARVRRIIDSASYRPAHADEEFMEREELRPARLELEYLKPELALQEHGIESTIVLFGGTRVVEPAVALRSVAQLEAQHAAAPADDAIAQRLRVARRVADKSHYYEVARQFAAIAGERCVRSGGHFAVMTGGGPGIMEAGNRGASESGAPSIGLNIVLPMEQYPNPYLTPGLCFQFRYFALRKLHFLKRARALVAFPGGYGTMDELFDALCLIQTRKITPMPVILVGRAFWERAIDFPFLLEEGVIDPEDLDLFCHAETAADIWSHIERWYAQASPPR